MMRPVLRVGLSPAGAAVAARSSIFSMNSPRTNACVVSRTGWGVWPGHGEGGVRWAGARLRRRRDALPLLPAVDRVRDRHEFGVVVLRPLDEAFQQVQAVGTAHRRGVVV